MEQQRREQRLHATLGIALPHEVEVAGPFGASSDVGSGTRSLPTRVRDNQIDATTWNAWNPTWTSFSPRATC